MSLEDLRRAEKRVTKVYVKLIHVIWNPLQNALRLCENITGFDLLTQPGGRSALPDRFV